MFLRNVESGRKSCASSGPACIRSVENENDAGGQYKCDCRDYRTPETEYDQIK